MTMAITKEKITHNDNPEDIKLRNSGSSRPSGVAGIPSSSRPSGVYAREYTDGGSITDELGYGRIVRVVKAIKK